MAITASTIKRILYFFLSRRFLRFVRFSAVNVVLFF